MRDPWISEDGALRERMSDPAQATVADPGTQLPAYATAFLAHLRLLVGVPFEYLVPDTELLPDESIRFFHLDRSWTDRAVDGVLAVGKVGSREQAHHHAAAPALDALLDSLEPAVRPVQRGQERIREAGKLGFTTVLVPAANKPKQSVEGVRVIAVDRVDAALAALRE